LAAKTIPRELAGDPNQGSHHFKTTPLGRFSKKLKMNFIRAA